MKRLLALILAISMIGVVGVSKANAQEANITITVQILSLGVSVTPDTWGIGVVPAGSTQDSGAFSVTNTGNVTEDFQLNTADSANWDNDAGPDGDNDNIAEENEFVLRGIFDTDVLPHQFQTEDRLTNTAQTAETAAPDNRFTDGDEDGQDVAAGSSVNLFLQLDVPTAGSDTSQQNITVTITAIQG